MDHQPTAQTGGTIVAVTTEDGAHEGVVSRAAELARLADSTVILFDLDADISPLESPLPTEWSGHGQEEQFGDRLGPNDLEAAGRQALARQVRGLHERGVKAFGWLPETADGPTLASYAADQAADLILVSTEDGELIESLRSAARDGATADRDRGDDRPVRPASRVRVEAVPPA